MFLNFVPEFRKTVMCHDNTTRPVGTLTHHALGALDSRVFHEHFHRLHVYRSLLRESQTLKVAPPKQKTAMCHHNIRSIGMRPMGANASTPVVDACFFVL